MSEAQSLPDINEPKVKTRRECLDDACEQFEEYCRKSGHICLKVVDDKDCLINLAVILSVTKKNEVSFQKANLDTTLDNFAKENNINIYGSRELKANSCCFFYYYYCFGLH